MQEPEPLVPVPHHWLKSRADLNMLARRLHTKVFLMPSLSLTGAFRVEALLGCVVLHYPGVPPLNLLQGVQVLQSAKGLVAYPTSRVPANPSCLLRGPPAMRAGASLLLAYIVQPVLEEQAAAAGEPLQVQEQQAITLQPGVSDWLAAAAAHPTPDTHDWDVFISHAGNSADKPFARALFRLLKRTGWGLRVFLDDESLVPAQEPHAAMRAAMESTAVAILLFSAEFFQRPATEKELQVLMDRRALNRVQLLPVFLRMQVDDCKQIMAGILGQGACTICRLTCPSCSDNACQLGYASSCAGNAQVSGINPMRGCCCCSALSMHCVCDCLCRASEHANRHPACGRAQQPAERRAQDRARDAVAHYARAVRPCCCRISVLVLPAMLLADPIELMVLSSQCCRWPAHVPLVAVLLQCMQQLSICTWILLGTGLQHYKHCQRLCQV